MQRLFYPIETVLSNKITRNGIVLSFKNSPRKLLGRRPPLSGSVRRPRGARSLHSRYFEHRRRRKRERRRSRRRRRRRKDEEIVSQGHLCNQVTTATATASAATTIAMTERARECDYGAMPEWNKCPTRRLSRPCSPFWMRRQCRLSCWSPETTVDTAINLYARPHGKYDTPARIASLPMLLDGGGATLQEKSPNVAKFRA